MRAFFAPYGEWKGLAGEYLRVAAARGLLGRQSCESRPGSSPSPARNSLVSTCSAFCGRVIRPSSSIQSA